MKSSGTSPYIMVAVDALVSVRDGLIDGSSVRLPDDMPGRYAILLFYRGHW